MRRLFLVAALALSSLFVGAAPAAADTPGPQSKCYHDAVQWNEHLWTFDRHYTTKVWDGWRWVNRHVHSWHHYIYGGNGYWYYQHTSTTYC